MQKQSEMIEVGALERGTKQSCAATTDQARATQTPHKRLERTWPAGGRPCRSGAGPTTTHDPTRFSSAVCLPAPAQAVVPPKGVNENKRTLRKQANTKKTSEHTENKRLHPKKIDNKC